MHEITLNRTRSGAYNSIPRYEEVENFNNMNHEEQDFYLQEQFYSKGFAEGANNLLITAKAFKKHGAHNVKVIVQYV